MLQQNGIKVVGVRVGDADPILAISDEYLAGRRYDAIVISTLPPEDQVSEISRSICRRARFRGSLD